MVPNDSTVYIQCIDDITVPIPPIVSNSCNTIEASFTGKDSIFNGCEGRVIYTYSYSDCINEHSKDWKFTYQIKDTVKPSFTVPADASVCRQLDESYDAGTSITGVPTDLYDNCLIADSLIITYTETATSHITSQDTITRIWKVADKCNDSSQVQRIFIKPVLRENIEDTICAGEIYDNLGFTFTAHADTILSHTNSSFITGCDSITTLYLTVNHTSQHIEELVACDSIVWHGRTFYESTDTATYHTTNANGCDSIVTLHLTITGTPELTIFATPDTVICVGNSVTLHTIQDVPDITPVKIGNILCTDGSIVKPSDWPVEGKTAQGIVFYVDNTGEHGWAVNLKDDSTECKWGVSGEIVPGVTDSSSVVSISLLLRDTAGVTNTQALRNHYNPSNYHYAACVVDFDHEWYLPAIGQLRLLYAELLAINSSLTTVRNSLPEPDRENVMLFDMNESWKYWSSTEYNTSKAWYVHHSGQIFSESKSVSHRVRSVRNF